MLLCRYISNRSHFHVSHKLPFILALSIKTSICFVSIFFLSSIYYKDFHICGEQLDVRMVAWIQTVCLQAVELCLCVFVRWACMLIIIVLILYFVFSLHWVTESRIMRRYTYSSMHVVCTSINKFMMNRFALSRSRPKHWMALTAI